MARAMFHDMQIAHVQLVELCSNSAGGRERVTVSHTMVRVERRQPYPHTLWAPYTDYCLGDLEQETSTLSRRPTVGIGAHVRSVSQKLIDQITVCGVNIHAIESGVQSKLC